jgi:SAM-dependent methyltransferase
MSSEPAPQKSPYESAEEVYRAALEVGRRSPHLNDRVAMIHGLRKALEIDPEGHAEIRGHLAWGYYCNSQFEVAAREYLEILEKSPNDPDANYYGGLSLIRSFRGKEAWPLLFRAARKSLPSQRGWSAFFLGLYYGIPINRFLFRAYRETVWVLCGLFLWVWSRLTLNSRFGTGSFLMWAMRNWPESYTPCSYARSAENEFALNQLDIPKGGLFLDIGTGPTPFIPFAATRGVRIIGCDPDPYIGAARSVCRAIANGSIDENLLLMQADGTRLPFPDSSLSRVLSISTIEHIPNDGDLAMMRDISRVLAPGGRAVVTTEGFNEHFSKWMAMPFHVGYLYDFGELDKMKEVESGTSIGFYRYYDSEALAERLGTVPGLRSIESGFLVDRTLMRRHFPDYPETLYQRIVSPWKALLGHFSYKKMPLPIPKSVDLTGAIGYVILEKPRIP